MWPNPPPAAANSRPPAFPPDPEPKPTLLKAVWKKGQPEVTFGGTL